MQDDSRDCSVDGVNIHVDGGERLSTIVPTEFMHSVKDSAYYGSALNGLANIDVTRTQDKDKLELSTLIDLTSGVLLDDFHYGGKDVDSNNMRERKALIMQGMLSLYSMVSRGLIYSVALNPLNLIVDLDPSALLPIKGFFRFGEPLQTIDDDWVAKSYKLMAYFLVDDPSITYADYDACRLPDLVNLMDDNTADTFKKILGFDHGKGDYLALVKAFCDSDVADLCESMPSIFEDSAEPTKMTSGDAGNLEDNDYADELPADSYEGTGETIPLGDTEPVRHRDNKQRKRKVANKQRNRKPKARSKAKSSSKGGSKVWLLILLVVLLLVGAGGYLYHQHASQQQQSPTATKAVNARNNPNFYNGLLSASLQDYDTATKDFDKFYAESGRAEMTSKEHNAVFFSYILDGQYNKALSHTTSNSDATALLKYLNTKGTYDSVLPTLKSNLAPIKFAQALKNKDWKTVVALKDKVSTTGNTTAEAGVAQGLVEENRASDALEYADSVNDPKLVGAIKAWEYAKIDSEKRGDDATKAKADFDNQAKKVLSTTNNVSASDYN